ncbi:MAG: pentapeptide repeat-containing protein [Proteobacteria bacterium]|nr:pentapeptide repeat-containing protein [Pseudomonadota bacterium]
MFEKKEYNHEVFSNLEIVGMDHSGKLFTDCRFENCHFETVVFKNIIMEHCVFSSCAIILPDMTNAAFDDVTFDDCKIVGCNFSTINNFNLYPTIYGKQTLKMPRENRSVQQ